MDLIKNAAHKALVAKYGEASAAHILCVKPINKTEGVYVVTDPAAHDHQVKVTLTATTEIL